jgi:hypothetical protein
MKEKVGHLTSRRTAITDSSRPWQWEFDVMALITFGSQGL